MAYIINKYNTAQLTVVEDGTIDQTTDLKLVGKNYAGYGEIQNENFVFLLENFAGGNQPPKALMGQIWFDSSTSKLKFYDGNRWRTTGGAEVDSNTPAGLSEGDFWWDTQNEQLYAYNGTSFVLIGPQGVGDSVTRFQSRTIRDSFGTNRPVIVSVVADEVIHIISGIEFVINAEEAPDYPGFDVVRQGLTLKNTTNSSQGATSTAHRWWGTATNADRLGGIPAENYVQTGLASFTNLVEFSDLGISIGDSNDLKIRIINDDKGMIANEQGREIYIQVNDINLQQQMPIRFQANSVLPGYSNLINLTGVNTVEIGSDSERFTTMFATTFNGRATLAATLELDGTGRSATVNNTANTIVGRDANRDIRANLFRGTATQAQYADLAEVYESDKDYEPGTVVVFGGEKEITESNTFCDYRIAGVVSTNPAHLMNSESPGLPIALRGKIPCKVVGPVKKGDLLVSAIEPGCAIAISPAAIENNVFVVGKSLEDNLNDEIKFVMIVV